MLRLARFHHQFRPFIFRCTWLVGSQWYHCRWCNHEGHGFKINPIMTSSNGNIFRVTGPLRGNSPVTGEFPSQRSVTRSFDIFFALRLNKRLSKQSWGWWFETLSRSLWRHCNAYLNPTKRELNVYFMGCAVYVSFQHYFIYQQKLAKLTSC